MKELVDGTKAFGVFNLAEKSEKYNLNLEKAGLKAGVELRDHWHQKSLGESW